MHFWCDWAINREIGPQYLMSPLSIHSTELGSETNWQITGLRQWGISSNWQRKISLLTHWKPISFLFGTINNFNVSTISIWTEPSMLLNIIFTFGQYVPLPDSVCSCRTTLHSSLTCLCPVPTPCQCAPLIPGFQLSWPMGDVSWGTGQHKDCLGVYSPGSLSLPGQNLAMAVFLSWRACSCRMMLSNNPNSHPLNCSFLLPLWA